MCQCRRCVFDTFNRHMAAGGRPYEPSDHYLCDLCRQRICYRAEDHRRDCIMVKLANARSAYRWNGKEMSDDDD